MHRHFENKPWVNKIWREFKFFKKAARVIESAKERVYELSSIVMKTEVGKCTLSIKDNLAVRIADNWRLKGSVQPKYEKFLLPNVRAILPIVNKYTTKLDKKIMQSKTEHA